MCDDLNIYLGRGLDNLKFGASIYEVCKYFGEAENTIEKDMEFEWHFFKTGIGVYFDEDEGYKLTGLEIFNHNALLWEKKIFEIEPEELLRLFKDRGAMSPEKEEFNKDDFSMFFDKDNCFLYFKNNQLDSLQWYPFFDDNGDNYIWP